MILKKKEKKKMKIKKTCLTLITIFLVMFFVGCHKKNNTKLTETQKIIKEAEQMDFVDLCKKAIAESNNKKFFGVGNSSRGKKALPKFIEFLQTIVASYKLDYDWQQPKNNKIFDQLTTDGRKNVGTFAMTLIQDGNQIQTKMVDTGVLDTYIPKEWATDNNVDLNKYDQFLALQTLNKVFMFNNTGSVKYDNCWDFVYKDAHGLFMDIDSEIVGKNFLYMLTMEKYATWLKEAYDKLSTEKKNYFDSTIKEVEDDAKNLKLGENGKYALAWIKLWVSSYNAQTDDGPICNTLVQKSATNQFGLLVYSKLRSIEESELSSKKNITVAAYQQGEEMYDGVKYEGIGGYGYCHYLFVTDNSPLPWTACAFIAYLTIINEAASTDEEKIAGFSSWGADMGGYSSNPKLAELNEKVYNHKKAGYVNDVNTFDCKNDRGFTWWETTGKLVLEDPAYCSKAAFIVGPWIELLEKYSGK